MATTEKWPLTGGVTKAELDEFLERLKLEIFRDAGSRESHEAWGSLEYIVSEFHTRLAEADKLAEAVWDWSSLGPYPDHDSEVDAEERIMEAYFDYNGRRPPRSLEGDDERDALTKRLTRHEAYAEMAEEE